MIWLFILLTFLWTVDGILAVYLFALWRRWPLPHEVIQELRQSTWGKLLVYDEHVSLPYTVALPLDVLRAQMGEHELVVGDESIWVCRRNGAGLEALPIEADPRQAKTSAAHMVALRKWRHKNRKPQANLLVYDQGRPQQPYMVTLPRHELLTRFGGLKELKVGGKSLWACRRTGEDVTAMTVERDYRTMRTPAYLAEFMKLRADKDLLSRLASRTQQMLLLGAVVGVCITTVAGLILVMALNS